MDSPKNVRYYWEKGVGQDNQTQPALTNSVSRLVDVIERAPQSTWGPEAIPSLLPGACLKVVSLRGVSSSLMNTYVATCMALAEFQALL